jgi:CBS domain-containing protein
MTVAKIMNPKPIVLNSSETVRDAIRRMMEKKVRSFPVVDGDGRYLGMFSLHRVLGMLLPRVATMDEEREMDLSFISDTVEHLKEKLADIGNDSVSGFMERDRKVAHPDTPLVEGVLLLYRLGANIPVVERDSGRLAGLLSPWEVLNQVAGGGSDAR